MLVAQQDLDSTVALLRFGFQSLVAPCPFSAPTIAERGAGKYLVLSLALDC